MKVILNQQTVFGIMHSNTGVAWLL